MAVIRWPLYSTIMRVMYMYILNEGLWETVGKWNLYAHPVTYKDTYRQARTTCISLDAHLFKITTDEEWKEVSIECLRARARRASAQLFNGSLCHNTMDGS